MKIIFKNGHEEVISDEIAKVLQKRLMSGCSQFQIFDDKESKLILIVNVSEIVCITKINQK